MFMAIQGIGLLISTIQGISQQKQMNQMTAQNQAMMNQMMGQDSPTTTVQRKEPPKTQSIFNFEGPKYPDESFKNLQNQQMGQAEARNSTTAKLHEDLQNMKGEFFGNNHYETAPGADGKHQVALDDQGRPKVAPGAEKPDQKLARVEYETQQKTQMQDKHMEQKENFMAAEKQNFKEFLTQNRDQLNNPQIHNQLQGMVVESKKKSLSLQQDQEDERLKIDLPPEQKIALRLEQGINDLHKMDRDNIKAEQDSPDLKELMAHDQKVAAILGEQKEKARQDKKEDEFLLDPRKMMAARQASESNKDLGEHLPGYLTANMYELGIYSV